MKCRNCDHEYEIDGQLFCAQCGMKQPTEGIQPLPTADIKSKSKKGKKALIISSYIIVLLVGIVATFYFMSGSNPGDTMIASRDARPDVTGQTQSAFASGEGVPEESGNSGPENLDGVEANNDEAESDKNPDNADNDTSLIDIGLSEPIDNANNEIQALDENPAEESEPEEEMGPEEEIVEDLIILFPNEMDLIAFPDPFNRIEIDKIEHIVINNALASDFGYSQNRQPLTLYMHEWRLYIPMTSILEDLGWEHKTVFLGVNNNIRDMVQNPSMSLVRHTIVSQLSYFNLFTKNGISVATDYSVMDTEDTETELSYFDGFISNAEPHIMGDHISLDLLSMLPGIKVAINGNTVYITSTDITDYVFDLAYAPINLLEHYELEEFSGGGLGYAYDFSLSNSYTTRNKIGPNLTFNWGDSQYSTRVFDKYEATTERIYFDKACAGAYNHSNITRITVDGEQGYRNGVYRFNLSKPYQMLSFDINLVGDSEVRILIRDNIDRDDDSNYVSENRIVDIFESSGRRIVDITGAKQLSISVGAKENAARSLKSTIEITNIILTP